MWTQVGLIGVLLFLLGLVVSFASKNGSKSAQLESLKAEIKKIAEEQARAKRIIDNVNALSDDDARERLRKLTDK